MQYIVIIILHALLLSAHGIRHDIHDMHGVLYNEHFPEFYKDNLNETWTITTANKLQIALYFTYFDLEDSYDEVHGPCPLDYIEIFDGEMVQENSMGKFCGNSKINIDHALTEERVFKTKSNLMNVVFISDYSNDLPGRPKPKGFSAYFAAEDTNECEVLAKRVTKSMHPEKVGKCDHYCHNFIGGYECTCKPGYKLHSNRYTCQGKCSDVYLGSSSGTVSSPGYPGIYPKLTDCSWTIETEIGNVIIVNFIGTFDIESHQSGNCPYDWIQITDGKSLKKYCGTTRPSPIVSTGNSITINFHSDSITEKPGFEFTYKTRGIFCNMPPAPSSGRIIETYGDEDGYLPFDSVVVFECEIGYEMVGVHKITCLKDGSFDDKIPSCISKK